MTNSLIRLRDMASQLGVPSKWLKEQAEAGKIPALKAGGRWLFDAVATTEAVSRMAKVGSTTEYSGGAQ